MEAKIVGGTMKIEVELPDHLVHSRLKSKGGIVKVVTLDEFQARALRDLLDDKVVEIAIAEHKSPDPGPPEMEYFEKGRKVDR